MDIKKAKYLKDYQIEVTFEDGVFKVADFGPFIHAAKNPMITQFKDLKLFKKFRVKQGDLVWLKDEEMDFDGDDIYKGKFDANLKVV